MAAFAAALAGVSPSQAETPRPAVQQARPPAAKATKPVASSSAGTASAYASAEPGCGVVRRRLWTEAGWIVRRVAACR